MLYVEFGRWKYETFEKFDSSTQIECHLSEIKYSTIWVSAAILIRILVPQCKNKESCKFDNAKCWYLHNEQNEKNVENHVEQEYDNNQLLLEKLFDMVEKMTERILKLENPSK